MSPDRTRPGRSPRSPFALLDELACYLDTPAEPNNVHIEVLVPGHLDERALRQAVTGAIAAAPRASGRMMAGGALRRRYLWEFPAVPDVDPVSRATWSDEDELVAVRNRFLADAPPLRTSPPVRLLLAAGPEATGVLVNAHHAALDGMSALGLLCDIATRYQAIAGTPELAPAPPASRPPRALVDKAPADRALRRSLARALRRYPAARIAPDRESRGRRDGQAVRLLLLPAVPRPASGATVTDVLVAALIATVARWNEAHGRVPRAIAISVPVSVHGPGLPTVAGNQTRMVTITVGPGTAAAQPSALLAEVSRQLIATRQARPQRASAGVLDATPGWCPVALKRLAFRVTLGTVGRVVCDTTMLSNLGNVTGPPWSGPGDPVRVAFSAPAHMPRGLAVSVVTADGQVQVAFRYRYALLDDTAAARFTGTFAAMLEEFTTPPAPRERAVPDIEGDARGPAGGATQDPGLPGRQGLPHVLRRRGPAVQPAPAARLPD
ncbi:MAG: hypothetical protein JWM19_6666 [Actinomycetia bacterium]|nr:hypothetical protein [Actinomycetes bacterium]